MPYYNANLGSAQTSLYNSNTSQGMTTGGPIITTIAYVNGEEGAKNYPVAAGNTVLLLDFTTNMFWLKFTSPNGMQQSLREFSFEEKTPKVEGLQTDYVTKEEFNDLRSYLENQFNGIKNQLQNQKRGYVNDKSNVK